MERLEQRKKCPYKPKQLERVSITVGTVASKNGSLYQEIGTETWNTENQIWYT
jgi:hypothetical protein